MKKISVNEGEIKAIIFDVGGVLCPEGGNIKQYKQLSKAFGFSLAKFKKLRKKHIKPSLKIRKPFFLYETSIAKDLKINPKSFIEHWQKLRSNQIKINKRNKKFLKKLGKNYFLGTLTNVTHGHDILREKNGVYSPFKINLKSCDLGIAKPSSKIFKQLLRRFKKKNITAREIIFIDDKERNNIIAMKFGIKTILFKNNKQLVRDLRKFGVKI